MAAFISFQSFYGSDIYLFGNMSVNFFHQFWAHCCFFLMVSLNSGSYDHFCQSSSVFFPQTSCGVLFLSLPVCARLGHSGYTSGSHISEGCAGVPFPLHHHGKCHRKPADISGLSLPTVSLLFNLLGSFAYVVERGLFVVYFLHSYYLQM